MEKYYCPFCGKSYTDRKELIECVKKCDSSLTESETKEKARKEKEEIQKKQLIEDAKDQRKQIDLLYSKIKTAVEKYNTTVSKLELLGSHLPTCSTSINYKTESKESIYSDFEPFYKWFFA